MIFRRVHGAVGSGFVKLLPCLTVVGDSGNQTLSKGVEDDIGGAFGLEPSVGLRLGNLKELSNPVKELFLLHGKFHVGQQSDCSGRDVLGTIGEGDLSAKSLPIRDQDLYDAYGAVVANGP